ncbi:FAD/NAD(P)-binding domain-containing protein [Thozetella sp. PMI_491]|nr:FAD/NAD(P)-binding domain-containing protein [Thozetella sp. PMI_491]
MPASYPKIAIIGAGPAGTMLARLLQEQGITCTVFEGESSPNYRSQGGTLDLHTSTGLLAVKKAGLWEPFLEKARFDSDLLQLADKNLNMVFRKKGASAPKPEEKHQKNTMSDQKPEIDRADLRQLLTESLTEGTIRWGAHLKSVEEDGTLVFTDRTESGFDLIVGAEGAWSKVRGLLSDVKPEFSGVVTHGLKIPDAANTVPELYAIVNHGNLFTHATGRKLTMQELGDGSLHVGASLRVEDAAWPKNCGYDATNAEEVNKALFEGDGPFADFHPLLKAGVAKASPTCLAKPLWQLPLGFRWAHKRGATLVGDAAHLMTPFAGEGVNVALEDAMKLSEAIVAAVRAHPDGGAAQLDALDQAVVAYEKELWPRAHKVMQLTYDLTRLWMFTPDTPRSVLPTMMARHMKYHLSPLLYPFASAGVHSYFKLMTLVKGEEVMVDV